MIESPRDWQLHHTHLLNDCAFHNTTGKVTRAREIWEGEGAADRVRE